MAIETTFTQASIVMTVISLATFLGILWWTYGIKRSGDFDAAARLPFDDDDDGVVAQGAEDHHG
jgi:cytochrome c oxidase cbb3-type subunit IV